MGSESSVSFKNHPVHIQQIWNKEASFGNYQLARNNQGKLGQIYNVVVHDIEKQMSIYRMRYDNPEYIPEIIQATKIKQQLFCGNNQRLQIVTERIPYRLSDLGTIGYGEGLYLLYTIIKSAIMIKELYLSKSIKAEMVNNISYTQNMIFITQKGTVKLWINENMSINEFNIDISDQKTKQSVLVEKLMNLVENKMKGNKFIAYMKQKIKIQQRQRLNTLEEALSFIEQMKLLQEQSINKVINNVIIPQLINFKDLQHKKTDQVDAKTTFDYGSNIRKCLQQAHQTHNYKKLEKPPIPRKTSKSKSKKSSQQKSKASTDRKLTPTKKPVARDKSPDVLQYQQNSIQEKPSSFRSFPAPSSLQIHPMKKQLSKSAINERQLQNVSYKQRGQKLNPFLEIQSVSRKELQEKKQANNINQKIERVKSLQNFQKINKFQPNSKGQNLCRQIKPIQLLNIDKNRGQHDNNRKIGFTFGELNRKQSNKYKQTSKDKKTLITLNGHLISSNSSTPFDNHKPISSPYKAPQITFKSMSPKVNFQYGKPS